MNIIENFENIENLNLIGEKVNENLGNLMNKTKKYVRYAVLPNFVYHNYFNSSSIKVYNDKDNINWIPYEGFSGYWFQFPEYTCFGYKNLIKALALVTNQMLLEDCDYFRERFALFSQVFLNMRMGDTIFIKYLTEEDYMKEIKKNDLEKTNY
jgi:hypothetical protein